MPKVFVPNPGQRKALQSKARVVVALGGVGGGKSALGAILSLLKIQTGQPGLIVAPEFSQLGHSTFPALMKWTPQSLLQNRELNHPWTMARTLMFRVDGKDVPVMYASFSEPETLTGISCNWVFADELARAKTRKVYDVLMARLREGPDPRMFIATTPRSRNWFFSVVQEGLKTGLMEVFYLPTMENRANLDPGYIDSLQLTYTGRQAEQELEGKFVSLEGTVFPTLTDANVTEDAEYVEGVPCFWGTDEGYTGSHKRAITFFQVIPPFVNCFDCYSAIYELPEKSIATALARPWPRPDVVYCDSSAAQLRGRLWDTDLDTVAASHPVESGIVHLSALICDGVGVRHLRFHPRAREVYDELRVYAYDEDTGKPIKEHDDWVDSTRYGTYHIDLLELVQEGLANPMARASRSKARSVS